eukprot:gnl/MRDRNA2_/MRDRNA2_143710_c0_seq1.p2 gnl/MRDRNA2_/MRDRNA2_143710_c0~~gnl/MRDRNA2_/MRDRNA2_143710_c0_seq1.p2  ORF type:complete len:193 (+),score=27.97 gnl/MRDRNA2_/MRDRNA2_143710_c0_seq1:25-579(+)
MSCLSDACEDACCILSGCWGGVTCSGILGVNGEDMPFAACLSDACEDSCSVLLDDSGLGSGILGIDRGGMTWAVRPSDGYDDACSTLGDDWGGMTGAGILGVDEGGMSCAVCLSGDALGDDCGGMTGAGVPGVEECSAGGIKLKCALCWSAAREDMTCCSILGDDCGNWGGMTRAVRAVCTGVA